MLFGKKTSLEAKDAWALVLNQVRGEVTKSRIIERMSQVFPIAIEEAADLVQNTPIILLEGLDRSTGEQVLNYFNETGVDLILTDDKSFQRRCFRAVWPSPPRFDFIDATTPVIKEEKRDKLEEVVRQSNSTVLKSLYDSNSTIEKNQKEETNTLPSGTPSEFDEIWRRNKLSEIELATSHAIQEEKIAGMTQEREQLLSQISSLKETASRLETERTRLTEEVKAYQNERKTLSNNLQQAETAQSSILKEKENALILAEGQVKRLEAKFAEEKRRLEAEIITLKSAAGEAQQNASVLAKAQIEQIENKFREERAQSEAKISKLMEEKNAATSHVEAQIEKIEFSFQEERANLEANISNLKAVSQNQKLQIDDLNEKWQTALQSVKAKETEASRVTNELSVLRVQSEELKRMVSQAQQALAEKQKEFEVILRHHEEKIKTKSAEADSLTQKLQEVSSAQQTILNRNQELQNQLEAAQKQIREFSSVIEQQELLSKRNRIISQISEKETRLKEISYRQEVLESNLRETQGSMKEVLTERETLEKEIASDRQTQKHLLEQLKLKEKNRASSLERNKSVRSSASPNGGNEE